MGRAGRVSVGLLAFCAFAGLICQRFLPSKVAIHWGIDGRADGFASPMVAVGIGLLPLAFIAIVSCAAPLFTRGKPQAAKAMDLTLTLTSFLMAGVYALILLEGLGTHLDVGRIIVAAVFALFAAIGTTMGNIEPNPYIGVRTRKTLGSPVAWRWVHSRIAPWWVASGILGAVTTLAVGMTWGMAFLAPLIAVPFVLSAKAPV